MQFLDILIMKYWELPGVCIDADKLFLIKFLNVLIFGVFLGRGALGFKKNCKASSARLYDSKNKYLLFDFSKCM